MAKKKHICIEFDQIKLLNPEEENLDFPSICRFIRRIFNITQQQMAQKLNITVSAYIYWEAGKRVPKSWQALNLHILYEKAKELSLKQEVAKEQTSQPASDNQQNAA